jgi:serine/threonine-protein kinase
VSADPDVLLDLAGADADGTPVDWKAFGPPQDGPVRGVIEEMALLARIGELHRTFGNGPDGHESAWDEAPDREPPARWGDLRLLERVGAGMAGEVFRAYDDRLQREVALKLFYPDHDGTASSALTEGRLLARVRHPNVVTVFGVDEFDGRVGVWMEFIRGRTLADRVGDDGPLPVRNAVETGTQLCDALEAVHRAHLLHRDIKPQNVMLADDGRVVLMDFSAGGEQLRRDQDVAGTPLYLAPELFLGGTPSVQSDVYSAGVVLFHLLTAAHPVSGRNVAELQRAHQARTREPLKSFRPDLPSALANLIDRAISPVPQ